MDQRHKAGVTRESAAERAMRDEEVLRANVELAAYFKGRRTEREARAALKTIKAFVRNESSGTIREAVLRELKRGGQVYFLHNDVESIQHRASKLAELLPEARIAIAHGQMHERDLE